MPINILDILGPILSSRNQAAQIALGYKQLGLSKEELGLKAKQFEEELGLKKSDAAEAARQFNEQLILNRQKLAQEREMELGSQGVTKQLGLGSQALQKELELGSQGTLGRQGLELLKLKQSAQENQQQLRNQAIQNALQNTVMGQKKTDIVNMLLSPYGYNTGDSGTSDYGHWLSGSARPIKFGASYYGSRF